MDKPGFEGEPLKDPRKEEGVPLFRSPLDRWLLRLQMINELKLKPRPSNETP